MVEGGIFPLPLVGSCGWINNEINTRQINRQKRNSSNSEHRGHIEMAPMKWPKQAAFILFRQRNSKFERTKKLRFGCLISKEVTRFVYMSFSALDSLPLDVSLPPGMGRMPFMWEICFLLSADREEGKSLSCISCFLNNFNSKQSIHY